MKTKQEPLNVLTIATGKKLYAELAANLARSFRWWNKDNGIQLFLATDMPEQVPADIQKYVVVLTLQPDELGKGFSPKLHLDKLAPPGQTLFIDSDCLIYGSLLPVFSLFKGHKVSVAGNYIDHGEWFGDVASVCEEFGIKHLPKFNGGLYYLENGPQAVKVYQTARQLEDRYDELGFVRLRGRPNDEVLMALAMELNGETPMIDDGAILAEFVNFQSGIRSDLLNGKAVLYNTPAHPRYQPDWPLKTSRPVVVHFLGHHNQVMPYIKEASLLKNLLAKKQPAAIAKTLTAISVVMPFVLVNGFKDLFRNLYHKIVGVRPVKTSERII